MKLLNHKMRFLALCVVMFSALFINVADARVMVGVNLQGGGGYAPQVIYVPGHWYHGYWITGRYVEYAGPAPGFDFYWIDHPYYRDHHWRRGYWRHR